MSHTAALDVFLLFVRGGEVLLALRENTGYADGQWNLPSGKVEAGEDLVEAAVREAREEVAVEVHKVRLATVVYVMRAQVQARAGFFFEVLEWTGEPVNAEPHKCGGLRWCRFEALPANTVPYTLAGVTQYRAGIPYGVTSSPRRELSTADQVVHRRSCPQPTELPTGDKENRPPSPGTDRLASGWPPGSGGGCLLDH